VDIADPGPVKLKSKACSVRDLQAITGTSLTVPPITISSVISGTWDKDHRAVVAYVPDPVNVFVAIYLTPNSLFLIQPIMKIGNKAANNINNAPDLHVLAYFFCIVFILLFTQQGSNHLC
jgi:hypothetical protein